MVTDITQQRLTKCFYLKQIDRQPARQPGRLLRNHFTTYETDFGLKIFIGSHGQKSLGKHQMHLQPSQIQYSTGVMDFRIVTSYSKISIGVPKLQIFQIVPIPSRNNLRCHIVYHQRVNLSLKIQCVNWPPKSRLDRV